MRKTFGIVVFLLTLLPVLNIVDTAMLHAQNFTYENGEYWLSEVEVEAEANDKVKCESCGEEFEDYDAFDRHLKYNTVCEAFYSPNNDEGDEDVTNGNCCFCGLPEDRCTCTGAECNGSYNGGDSGFGGSIGAGDDNYAGGGNSSNSGFSRYISVAELKNKKGVHLVSYINLPDKLHPQTKSMECVIRAFSFLAELKGHDYATAYEVLTNIAIDKRYDFTTVPLKWVNRSFKELNYSLLSHIL